MVGVGVGGGGRAGKGVGWLVGWLEGSMVDHRILGDAVGGDTGQGMRAREFHKMTTPPTSTPPKNCPHHPETPRATAETMTATTQHHHGSDGNTTPSTPAAAAAAASPTQPPPTTTKRSAHARAQRMPHSSPRKPFRYETRPHAQARSEHGPCPLDNHCLPGR